MIFQKSAFHQENVQLWEIRKLEVYLQKGQFSLYLAVCVKMMVVWITLLHSNSRGSCSAKPC